MLAFDLEIASLDLLERDAVVTESPGVDQHLVLLDCAAKSGHIDHAWHGFELCSSTQSWTALSSFRVYPGPSST